MAHYFAEQSQLSANTLQLPKADYTHLMGSLRLQIDEPLRIVVDQRIVLDTVVTAISKSSLSFTCLQETPVQPPAYSIDLALCLTKHDAFCETLHHCTQLPVYRFIPLISAYSVPQLSDQKLPDKLLRWNRILNQSSCQCERLHRPSIDAPKPSLPWVQAATIQWQSYDCVLFCDETKPQQTLGTLRPIRAKRILAIIGPEGGFSDAERTAMAQTSATPIALGSTIFKAPQAAFYVGAVLQHELENCLPT
jgi:16S rRNA (uracil1498-N3)-methyltransferase